jgi:hypothetical protein
MSNVTVDPRVIELGKALNQGYTSIAAKNTLEKHARSGRLHRKAEAKRRNRAARAKREAGWS